MEKTTPVNKEFLFKDSSIISQTDSTGIIVYANRKFCEISGYTKEELLGQSHNIIRHPNMPQNIFKKMWDTISTGHTWTGLIKNIRKDGQYYWVEAEILPIYNDNKEITGYISARREPSRKNISEIELTYKKMYEDQN